MRIKMTCQPAALIAFLSATCLMLSAYPTTAATIGIGEIRFAGGQKIAIAVFVQTGTQAVDAFGFDLRYPSDKMEYQSIRRGELIEKDFDLFSVQQVEPGRLRVGAAEAGGRPIPSGSQGTLFQIRFRLTRDCAGEAELTDLKDDLAGWNTQNRSFDLSGDLALVIQVLKIACGAASDDGLPPCLQDTDADGQVGIGAAIELLQRVSRHTPGK